MLLQGTASVNMTYVLLLPTILAYKHVVWKTDFTTCVDYSALVHMLKAKLESPAWRIKKLIKISVNTPLK